MKNDNPAPDLERSWLEAELKPSEPKTVTTERVEEFQKKLADICNMHIFCGPMIIAPDANDSLLPYKTNKQFKPRDWNAYTWWTRKDAPNVLTVLDHSHESLYYYPEHNLIDISIATCNKYDLQEILKFIYEFWQPDQNGIRYAFLTPKNFDSEWQVFDNGAPEQIDDEEKEIREKVKDRLDKLRSRKAYNYLLVNLDYASNIKKRDEGDIAKKLEKVEENLPTLKRLIKDLRQYIPHIWEQTNITATYLLVGKAYSNLETIILLAKKGHNLEVIEVARSAIEALDLAFLFLEDGQNDRLTKWFSGKIISNEKSRKVFHKVINEFKKDTGMSATLPIEDLKKDAYGIYSLYTHSSYRSLLDAIDVFHEDFDFERISGFHYANENLHVIKDVVYKLLLELENIFIKNKDKEKLKQVENLLVSLGYERASQKEIDEFLKKYSAKS